MDKSIPSYSSFDYSPVNVVPVIASFDSEGHIAPLYVRLCGNSCRIEKYWIKSTFVNTIQYNCQITDGETKKQLLLTYFQDESIWTIPYTEKDR